MTGAQPGHWGFLMGWTARDASVRNAGWADPLGLRSEAGSIADSLVPVFRMRHTTPEQFGLFCYAMRGSPAGAVDRFLAIERMWTLACAQAERPWPGRRRATQALRSSHEWDLSLPLMSDQLRTGLWASNRGAAGKLGLIARPAAAGSWSPGDYRLTPVGAEMARTFSEHFVPRPRQVAASARSQRCSAEALAAFMPRNDGGSAALARLMTQQVRLRVGDREMAEALKLVYDHAGSLSVSTVHRHRALLTDGQRTAALQAQSLARVIELVERPFRLWTTAQSEDPPEPGLWDHPAWQKVGWSYAALRVQAAGRGKPGWRGLEQLARRLAAHRSAPFPDRGGFRPGWETVRRERFRLDTFAALLDSGLMEPA